MSPFNGAHPDSPSRANRARHDEAPSTMRASGFSLDLVVPPWARWATRLPAFSRWRAHCISVARKSCMDVHDLRVRPRRGRANAGLSYEASKIADERGDDARKEADGDERIRELQEPLDEVRAVHFFGAGSLGPYGTSRRVASAEVRPALDGSVAITSHAGRGGPAFGRRRRSIPSRRRRSGDRSDDRRSPPRRSSDPGRDRVWSRSGRIGASPSRARR